MSSAAELDIGPLTWVKGEIDLALERAGEALGQFAAAPQEAGHLKIARNHLHQARGALSIVGLDGLTHFAESLEVLLAGIESGEIAFQPAAGQAAQQGLSAVRNYLDDLVSGAPDQALRLLPAYKGIMAARGQAQVEASDLFFPDLTLRPPRREKEPPPLSPDVAAARIKAARLGFERGLLKWLKQNPKGLTEMRNSVAVIEMTQSQPAARAFWWVTLAFLDTLASGTVKIDAPVRRLCGRIDAQIKKVIEGSRTVAERLMRDALYYVAIAPPGGDHVECVRAAYRLADLVPQQAATLDITPLKPTLRAARDLLSGAKDEWNRFCAGTAAALPAFHERVKELAARVGALEHADIGRLAAALVGYADGLRANPLRHDDSSALEVATAVLLFESALDNFPPGHEFAHQATVIADRLAALGRGEALAALELPQLDEMSKKAQERLLMAQVAKEILANLGLIEQALDTFFRNPVEGAELAQLQKPLGQILGALMVLGQDRAVEVLRECEGEIARFAAPDYAPQQSDFEEVARKLSALGFFVEKLQFGAADIDAILTPMRAAAPEPEEVAVPSSVEQELVKAMSQTQILAEQLKAMPQDAELRGELKQNLETLREDAHLVADAALAEQAQAAITALEGELVTTAIEAAVSKISVAPPAAAEPSPEAARLAEASSEEIDAELLGIFIEEAHEVLATVGAAHPELSANPHDRDTLTTIRRAFHTLKGSGRMVGLAELGEAAWAVEQVMNRWLQQERDATPALLAVIQEAHALFEQWVAQLESGGGTHYDATTLIAHAESLKSDEETPAPAPPAPVAAEAAAIEAAAAERPALEFPEPGTEVGPGAAAAEEIRIEPPAAAEEAPGIEAIEILEAPELPGAEAAFEEALAPESAPPESVPIEFAEPAPDMAAAGQPALELPELIEEVSPGGAPPAEEAQAELPTVVEEAPGVEAIEILEAPELPETEGALEEEPAGAAILAFPTPAPVRIGALEISATLFDLFLGEARGYVAALQRGLESSRPIAAEQVRAAHTLAGISATTGLLPLHTLAHALETALARLASAEASANEAQRMLLARAVGALEGMIGAVAERRMPATEDALSGELEALRPAAPAPATAEVIEIAPLPEAAAIEPFEALGLPSAEVLPLTAPGTQAAPIVAPPPQPAAEAAPPPVVTPAAPAPQEGERRKIRLQDDLDMQLLPIFMEEAQDLMREIGVELRAWRAGPGSRETQQQLQRLLHTFKGSARMAGAMAIGELLHNMETRIEVVTVASPMFLDDLDTSYDRAAMLMDNLRRVAAGEAVVEIPGAEAVPAAAVEAAPEAALPEAAAPGATPAQPTAAARELPAEPEAVARPMLRVRANVVDRLVDEAGEMAIARARIEGEMRTLKGALIDLTENVIRLRNQLREIEIQAETQMQSRLADAQAHDANFDPLEMDRFTRFQELTRMMAESVNDVATVQHNLLRNLDHADAALVAQARMNRELSQSLMSVRMVPFNTIGDRLYRVVRQTAKELDKRANLDIRGGQTELDRSVLEKMTGPIEHLLRNAIAHGIEPRAQRLAAGKAEIGEISLTLSQAGNEILIELGDDGAGLNLARIRSKAIERGLIGADAELGDDQVMALIFQPGFSTAEEVTEVAGRGVGMDVVKSEAASLGGRIEIGSETGKGSRFRIYLPLTLAVTQAVLVRSGNHTYAVPSTMVEQVSEMKPEAIAAIRGDGGTEWLGNRYPWHYIGNLLGDPAAQPQPARRHWLMLLRAGSQRLALEVDGLLGNEEIVVKNIGAQLARVPGIAGATVLGTGEIALILNPVALLGRELKTVAAAPAIVAPVAEAAATPAVMVVDDSLTVRKITGRLLAREGYHVLTARDGVDALEQLTETIPDVMLVDIEMPRMDGFELTRNVRADARLAKIPVIMITSRIAEKHRNYAKEIGVDHYLGKPYDEDQLLKLIADYVKKPG